MHQGEAAALLRAQAWRDEVIKKHPPTLRREIAQILRSNNTSGISGVPYRQHNPEHPGSWIAVTSTNGTRLYRTFAVKEHGYEAAKALAIAERQKQLEQLEQLARLSRKTH